MNKPHVNFEEYVAKMENSHANKAIIIPYIKGGNIVDFGAGTGKLAEMIKAIKPTYRIVAVEKDPAMRDRLNSAVGVDNVVEWLDEIYEPVDTVIFNSVLHEVESYSYSPLKTEIGEDLKLTSSGDLVNVLRESLRVLSKGGRIIIRDGFLDDNHTRFSVRLLNDNFDVDYYIANYRYANSLNYSGNRIEGEFNEMKEFLNKLTWGMDSLPREINERINFLSQFQWYQLLEQVGFNVVEAKTYMQPSYFYHLQKAVELDRVWDTHILIIAEKA